MIFAFLLTAAPAAAGGDVSVAHARSLTRSELPQPARATHDLALHLYAFRGTRWTEREIVTAMSQVARLIGICAVALTHVELRVLDAPRHFHFYSTPRSRELLRALTVAKPAVFFVEDTHNDPAFDAEAIGRANAASRSELADTVWVAYGARDLPFAIAHELVHVLSNSGDHSDGAANLMRSETSPANNRLTSAQCAAIRRAGEANGLLTRR